VRQKLASCLKHGEIFQPAGPVRVYQVEPDVLDDALLPSGVHTFDETFAGNPIKLVVCAGVSRAAVEQQIGSTAQLLGVYEQTGTHLVWHDALSFERVRALSAELIAALETNGLGSVRMPDDTMTLLSPEYYPSLLVPLMNRFATSGLLDEARKLAEIVSWVEPDLPSVRRLLSDRSS